MVIDMNDDGLTFGQWCDAAGLEPHSERTIRILREAWDAGEDPSEWKRALELGQIDRNGAPR